MGWPFADLPMFGFDFFMVDPPWRFELYNEESGSKKGAAAHYVTMSLDAIKALPVGALAARDALMWLWCPAWAIATGQAQEVARAWGFQPKSEIVWLKRTINDRDRVGPGYRVRTMHEPILLCTVGNPEHKPFPSIFKGLAREHSRKPDEAYRLIDLHCPNLRGRADLFSRTTRPGWTAWGDQIGHFDKEAA